MLPELGHYALILALCMSLVLAGLPLLGAWRGIPAWMAVARPAANAQFFFLLFAYLALTVAFVQNDFSVLYVAEHSNSRLPLVYRIAAVWGGHEGSMLLWLLMLGGWTMAVSLFSRRLPPAVAARVLGVMGLVSVGLVLFTLLTSNPFERLLPAAVDGADLNPLLQDPVMAIHPPMLYMGYVGFSVVFAFAIAALLGGRLDAAWARWSRPWTLAAWAFLTLGICLGSWWAYYELGWGGWWFWDPVENASFMPWLVGTALIHSLAVTEKRSTFKSWTVLLAILAFSLSLLGTFLVRSGVLTSVHAFATDPSRGLFILAFLGLVVGASLLLYALRAGEMGAGAGFAPVSRESLLLTNNVLLVVATATVLLGTLYPLALDALGMGKISVGPPYFDTVFVPLMTPLVFLMALGPVAAWKRARLPEMARRLRWAAGVGVATAVGLPFVLGDWRPMVALGLFLSLWLTAALAADLLAKLRRPAAGPPWRAVSRLSRGYWGMVLAHFGVAVFIFGVTVSEAYSVEREIRMSPGERVQLGPYSFRFDGERERRGPNYVAMEGIVTVFKGDRVVSVLHPQKRRYDVRDQVMTEAAIDAGLSRHLYVALGEPVPGTQDWGLRLYVKPWIQPLWLGAVLMGLGGALAATDRRYRRARREHRVAAAVQAAGDAA